MKRDKPADVVFENFEWNAKKAAENLKRRQISFEEATSVFDDPFFIIFGDPDHSFNERRFIIIGMSEKLRYLFVSFAENQRIRIISARKLTTKERRDYESKRPKF